MDEGDGHRTFYSCSFVVESIKLLLGVISSRIHISTVLVHVRTEHQWDHALRSYRCSMAAWHRALLKGRDGWKHINVNVEAVITVQIKRD